MIKAILRILGVMIVLAVVFAIGKTTVKQFGADIEFKNPIEVLAPTAEKVIEESEKIIDQVVDQATGNESTEGKESTSGNTSTEGNQSAEKEENKNTADNSTAIGLIKVGNLEFPRENLSSLDLAKMVELEYVQKIEPSEDSRAFFKELFEKAKADEQVYEYKKGEKPTVTYVKLNETSVTRQKGNKQSFDKDPIGWPKENPKVTITHPTLGNYSGWLWNRSHLIADQLGGPSTPENSIPGTRPQNVGGRNNKGGMRAPEERAYKYVSETKKELLYFVDVIYKNEKDLIPTEVRVTLYNDEIFETYITHNVANGFDINYETGEVTQK